MKLAFIIDNLYGGGAERAEINIMNALSENHDVTAICYRKNDRDKNYPLSPKVRLIYLKPRYPTESAFAFLNWLARFGKIREIRKRERFDAVVSFLDGGNAYNILTARDEKTVISIRNLISRSAKRRASKLISPEHTLLNSAARLLQNRADQIVCVSEDVARDQILHFRAPEEKVTVVQNFVDTDLVANLAREENQDAEFLNFRETHDVLFANCGRLVFQKGQWHLLKAFAEVVRAHPRAGLFIVGEGKLEAYLRRMIADYGLSENVMLCGYQTNPMKCLKHADWLVHSALYEGMSNTILEALALGLPVISTDCAGTREILTPQRPYGQPVETVLLGEYGILCPLEEDRDDLQTRALSESEKALAAAMCMAIDNPALQARYRAASARRVKAFSKEIKISEWERKLAALVSGV